MQYARLNCFAMDGGAGLDYRLFLVLLFYPLECWHVFRLIRRLWRADGMRQVLRWMDAFNRTGPRLVVLE